MGLIVFWLILDLKNRSTDRILVDFLHCDFELHNANFRDISQKLKRSKILMVFLKLPQSLRGQKLGSNSYSIIKN